MVQLLAFSLSVPDQSLFENAPIQKVVCYTKWQCLYIDFTFSLYIWVAEGSKDWSTWSETVIVDIGHEDRTSEGIWIGAMWLSLALPTK